MTLFEIRACLPASWPDEDPEAANVELHEASASQQFGRTGVSHGCRW